MTPPEPSADHAAAVRRAFTRQAAGFEDPGHKHVFTTDVEWIYEGLELRPDDIVLDVAGGTGHAARVLAPAVRAVVVLDATPEMLATGRRAADEAGVRNLVFVEGDAARLPFPDRSFDVVVCRFAVHHFEDAEPPVREMGRCARPGARLLLADLVADDDPEVAERQNRLERLRDPSQSRMLPVAELAELAASAGWTGARIETRDLERPLGPWLEHRDPPPEATAEIVDALHAELAGGAPTGFRPSERDGELWFVHRFAAVVA